MVRPIVPPTVPEGTQRVRVCLHAGNSFEDVERLVLRIREWLEVMRTSERKHTEEVEFLKASL
jgi:8-amino-7-oxononanoate synthase